MELEEGLARQARDGSREAFEELVRRTSRMVYARLYLETGDTHQAEDLLQETLLTAFRTLTQLENPERFRPWLLRIAQNAAIETNGAVALGASHRQRAAAQDGQAGERVFTRQRER